MVIQIAFLIWEPFKKKKLKWGSWKAENASNSISLCIYLKSIDTIALKILEMTEYIYIYIIILNWNKSWKIYTQQE